MFGPVWQRPFRREALDADEQLHISELRLEEREYLRKLFRQRRERDERRRATERIEGGVGYVLAGSIVATSGQAVLRGASSRCPFGVWARQCTKPRPNFAGPYSRS